MHNFAPLVEISIFIFLLFTALAFDIRPPNDY